MERPELLPAYLVINCEGDETFFLDKRDAEEALAKEEKKYRSWWWNQENKHHEAWLEDQKAKFG